MKSIFEPRENINFDERFSKLADYITDQRFKVDSASTTFFSFAEFAFNEWPFRGMSFDIDDYFKQLNINIDTIWNREIEYGEKFHIIEFVYNYSMWLMQFNIQPMLGYVKLFASKKNNLASSNFITLSTICDFIEKLVSLENYAIKKSSEKDKYLIIINDLEIATITPTPENANLIELIYNYLDYKNVSVVAKEAILSRIYVFIEDHFQDYNVNGSRQLLVDVKNAMNNTKIRHGGNGIKELTDEEKIDIYDKCFKMAVHLIKTPEINNYQKEIRSLSN